ncbi:MAG TPA: glycosyltransferase family 9 protein [Ktedonobacteraceae bacterium]|nr:glycosyltransferase family 9 protein [Ktedonobacteraceae bacterium]
MRREKQEHPFDKEQHDFKVMCAGECLADVRKIAVLRANGLGDFIFILPALEALRATYPQAELVLLALPWHAAFLRQRPSPVDRVIEVPPYQGVSSSQAEEMDQAAHFFQAMRQERFDLACQLHGGGHFSNPFVKSLGARVTIGLKDVDAIALDRWLPYCYFQQEYARYLEVVSLAGAVSHSAEPHITVTEQDFAEARHVLPETRQPLAILHPGANDPGRRWPTEKFAQVGDALACRGLHVAITGTQTEQEIVARVADAMHMASSNLCAQLSPGGLAALLARSCVVISNDSGPLHLAHAVGARTVGIYWCFNVITAAPTSRCRHRPVVSWQLNCPVCGCDRSRDHCPHTASFVGTISAEAVLAEVDSLVNF